MRIEDYLLCILFDSFPWVTLCITIKDFGWVTCKDISETCFSLEIQFGEGKGGYYLQGASWSYPPWIWNSQPDQSCQVGQGSPVTKIKSSWQH